MAALETRPLEEDDIPAVERAVRRIPGSHRKRLERQSRGEAVYLFAWAGSEPVGHVLLVFSSALGADAAHVEDLAVDEPWRRRGIGTELMNRCEREALARGYERIEFGVGVDNDGARAFYRRLGYAELPGQVPHVVRWPQLEPTGAIGEGEEWCTTFTKQLR